VRAAPPPPPSPPPPPPPPPPAAPAPPKAFTFGRRDPHEKASRLARVLVSDIITYNPERHQRALDGGTLKADFEDEIKKSWGEYVDQVGKELAESTQYFNEALNEILARGQRVF
jgi:translation initiation factor IF-2